VGGEKSKLKRSELKDREGKAIPACLSNNDVVQNLFSRNTPCLATKRGILKRRFESESTLLHASVDLSGIVRNLDFFARRCVWKVYMLMSSERDVK
jgi:hypothetical protein